jgi:xylulokinase
MSLLGIDIGSSRCKGVVFDEQGTPLHVAAISYTINTSAADRAEVNANVFWSAVIEITKKLSAAVPNDPIRALAISSHGETFVPVDKNGDPVAPAIMNSDNRAVAEVEALEKALGRERIYAITGLPPHAMYSLCKIVWLKKHSPELFAKISRFLSVEEFILGRMGVDIGMNYSSAGRTMAFDIQKKTWSQEILEAAGISKVYFNDPVPSGIVAGRLNASVASTLGLTAGTLVATGGHDQPCGALGAGVIASGEVSDSAGTYECLTAISNRPCNTPESLTYSLNSYPHVIQDQYVTLAFFPAGLVCRWFVEQFCGSDRNVYDDLEENIMKKCIGPTGVCVTPHFVGACNPHWDVHATGAVIGLTPAVTRYHLYKAIHEGIACELNANIDVLEKLIGPFNAIRIFGGNSVSKFTVQLRANITGKIFELVSHSEACCQGAAILAGMAAGIYKNAREGVRAMVRCQPAVHPNSQSMRDYEKKKRNYEKLYPSLNHIHIQEK